MIDFNQSILLFMSTLKDIEAGEKPDGISVVLISGEVLFLSVVEIAARSRLRLLSDKDEETF